MFHCFLAFEDVFPLPRARGELSVFARGELLSLVARGELLSLARGELFSVAFPAFLVVVVVVDVDVERGLSDNRSSW